MNAIIYRDFPYGLSLEPIQTRNLRDYDNTTSPSLNTCGFFDIFPVFQPE